MTYHFNRKETNRADQTREDESRVRVSLIKKEWYHDILIKPNVYLVETLYTDIEKNLILWKTDLDSAKTTLTVVQYNSKVAGYNRRFKKDKRDFEFQFIGLLNSVSSDLGQRLTSVINKLDDIVSDGLDDVKTIKLIEDNLKTKIYLNRTEFYASLYQDSFLG